MATAVLARASHATSHIKYPHGVIGLSRGHVKFVVDGSTVNSDGVGSWCCSASDIKVILSEAVTRRKATLLELPFLLRGLGDKHDKQVIKDSVVEEANSGLKVSSTWI